MASELHIEDSATKKIWKLRSYERLVFGRAPLADATISWDSFLSGTHFEIQFVPGAAIIHDLGSSNGTYLNGTRVHWRTICDGDEIQAGNSKFTVRLPDSKRDHASPMVRLASELGCSSTLIEVR